MNWAEKLKASTEGVESLSVSADATPPPATTAAPSLHCEDDNLEEAMKKLWSLDENRLVPGTDYRLDVQGYTHYHGDRDFARRPLFEFVSEEVFEKPTYKAFLALLDNFEREVGSKEKETWAERQENKDFLNEIYNTKPIQYVFQYLKHKNIVESKDDFLQTLYVLWFKMYNSTRGGPLDSSGFEHVFVGEENDKSNTLTGYHNWIQIYHEEKAGRFDYHGYISRNRERPAETEQILTFQFSATDAEDGSVDKKPMSTSFIGVSPEFEIALYTLIALAAEEPFTTKDDRGKEITKAELGDYQVELHCVKWGRGKDTKLRTAYPQA